jgi:hypothetical protein
MKINFSSFLTDNFKSSLARLYLALNNRVEYPTGYNYSEALTDNNCYPLSFQQYLALLLFNKDPHNTMWVIHDTIILQGSLNFTAFQEAVYRVFQRHSSLRTKLSIIDGQPYQKITPIEEFDLNQYLDLDQIKELTDIDFIGNIVLESVNSPFSSLSGPLCKIKLMTFGDHTVITFVAHHSISDDFSINIFWDELCKIYNDIVLDKPDNSLPLNPQYVDFALWQRSLMKERMLCDSRSFWINQLFDHKSTRYVPLDLDKLNNINLQNSFITTVLNQELVKRLDTISYRHKVPLFSMMLSACFWLLHTISGNNDIVIGTIFSGRNKFPESNKIIGMFINTLPIRQKVSCGMPFDELVTSTNKTVYDAYKYQYHPFETFFSENQLLKLKEVPTLQVMFNMISYGPSEVDFHQLKRIETGKSVSAMSPFDLNIVVHRYFNKADISFEYSDSLFNKETIKTIFGNYLDILHKIAYGNRLI